MHLRLAVAYNGTKGGGQLCASTQPSSFRTLRNAEEAVEMMVDVVNSRPSEGGEIFSSFVAMRLYNNLKVYL